MIKRILVHICLVTCVLAGILVGCGHVPHYDEQLLQADSLLQDIHDSHTALKLLDSLQRGSFANEADRAYYDLLLTQARYKCYILATSDSDINRALEYYKHHSDEQDKLIRSYIYKGAVMEELGVPDTAMIMYKEAEAVIPPGDYANLGYVKMRMASLYHDHHAYNGRDIEKLEQALECFRQANDTHYQIVCLRDLGAMYRSTDSIKAKQTLNEAIELASQNKDTANLINCYNTLAYMHFMQGSKDKAHYKLAYQLLQKIKQCGLKGLPTNVYTTFACVYANMGMPDSAMTYLNMVAANEQDTLYRGKTNYLEALSQIAKAHV